jgi:DNA invertase Pin-like site-specific DNA recombinase
MERIMRIYIYLRSNTSSRDGMLSLANQESSILNWAKNHNHIVVDKFVDEGFSGKRPSFEKMIAKAVENTEQIDGIIVYSFSRVSRNQMTRLTAKNTLENAGIKLYSVTEELPGDEDLAFILKNIIGTVNEHQSKYHSKSVKNGLIEAASQGFFTGGVIPFGYQSVDTRQLDNNRRRKSLIINPTEAKIINTIYNLHINGNNGKGLRLRDIANYLNKYNHLKRNKYWTVQCIKKVLSDSINHGNYQFKYRETSKVTKTIDVCYPAIITQELFNQAQLKLKHNRLIK